MTTLRTRTSNRPLTRSNTFLFFVAASLLALLAIAPHSARAQGDCADCDVSSNSTPGNPGTNFLLCFERNHDTVNDPNLDDNGYLEVFVAALDNPTTVTITCKHYPALNKVISLAAHASFLDTITEDQGSAFADLWIVSDEVVDDRVVQVTSTAPIVCSGMDYKYQTADAAMALPKSASATDYRIMAYQNSTNSSLGNTTVWSQSEFCPSQFVVAAFDDNTTVTITPNAPTLRGHAAGVPFTVTLNAGECIQVQTDKMIPGLDLTGSAVSSSDFIAVYSGNARTEMPAGWLDDLGLTSRDMLWEAMIPTSTWGSNFVLDAIDTNGSGGVRAAGDLMRALALNDNTIVTVNGKPWVTLNHNQFADSMITGPLLVQGSGALLVGEYAHSASNENSLGDPFLGLVPAIDQSFNNYTFLAYPDPLFQYNGVIIATDNNAKGTISYDGNLLPALSPYQSVPGTVGGESYSILELELATPGVHTLTSTAPPTHGFTILSYGLGNVVSYGYTGGNLLIPHRAIQIEYPPQSIGGRHSDTVTFRNTCYMPDYMDSAIFVPTNPKLSVYGIHFAENVAFDVGRLAIGGSAEIHLVADGPLGSPVSGTVKIYCHTPAQFNLEPAEMPYTLYPDATAGVQPGETVHVEATASPNPFSLYTTLNFSMPATTDVTIVLYNDLGQVVQNIASGEFPAGPYAIRIDRRGLPNGFYTCLISSEKLNFKEHVAIVIGE